MLCVRVPSDPGKPEEHYMEEHLLYYCCRRMQLRARGLTELWKCCKDSFPASFRTGRTSLPCTALPSSHLSQGTSLFYKHQLQTPGNQWLHPKLMDKARKTWMHIDLTPFCPKTSLWEVFLWFMVFIAYLGLLCCCGLLEKPEFPGIDVQNPLVLEKHQQKDSGNNLSWPKILLGWNQA